jgi:cell division protein FtsQ
MADIPSVSSTELAERRRKLRRQRRWRFLQVSWQVIAVTGLTVGAVWIVTLPDWMLRNPGQIAIEGNEFLSADSIRALLPIAYPQSLLAVQPQQIAQQLESQAPIAEATVTRRLFPPGLTVHIQERYPVAIAYASPSAPPTSPIRRSTLSSVTPVALLDDQGTWIPYENYVALNQSRSLPTLKVIGMQKQYRSEWINLYQEISHSPVKVFELDWRDPANLILNTDLGMVYCGAYSARFGEQLRVLDRMRQLPKDIDSTQVAYIDLRNLESPMIELNQSTVDGALDTTSP